MSYSLLEQYEYNYSCREQMKLHVGTRTPHASRDCTAHHDRQLKAKRVIAAHSTRAGAPEHVVAPNSPPTPPCGMVSDKAQKRVTHIMLIRVGSCHLRVTNMSP
jgi:hypothetical protein